MATVLIFMLASCWLPSTLAQSLSESIAAPTRSAVGTGAIASVLANSGLVPADEVDSAASALSGIILSTQATIESDLTNLEKDSEKLLNPEGFYSYGWSEPVYPSPQGVGDGLWKEAYTSARAIVAQMTDKEKNNITVPASNLQGCAGFTGSVPRLGFPGICLNDSPSGVRNVDAGNVSGFPAGISVGASWDKGLAWWRGYYMGREFKAKGINVALGPVVGPLGRIAKGGRNWESFTNDPYLAGSLVAPTIQGLQESVIACVKHFIGNEQETNRNPFLQGFLAPLGINLNNSVSANIDDRTMHELYLWPFYDAVAVGVGSVMASYNRINNSYGAQNSKTLNGLLKTELGFQGFVLSDWHVSLFPQSDGHGLMHRRYAQHTGIASANAGLDLVMPNDNYWGNNQLATAVSNGSVNATRLDDMAVRILASWYRYAQFQDPGVHANNGTDAIDPASSQILLQAAVDGHVLVKNVNSALPLRNPQAISVFGWDAISGYNTSTSDATLYQYSLQNTRRYTNGAGFGDLNFLILFASIGTGYFPEVAFNGTMISGGGSGGIVPASMISPYDALLRECSTDGTTLHTEFLSLNPVVPPSDACLVLVNAQSSESADRNTLADTYSDDLIANVASQCNNTIVVIHNAGIRLPERFIGHENVTAVIFAHLPGERSGDALVEILYGRQSPSGRLPYTVAKNESDYGSLLDPTYPDAENPQYSQSNFTEGVFIDYRHFLKENIIPRFEFGFGLTYTNFSYSELSIAISSEVNRGILPPDMSSGPAEGGLSSLYDIVATASVNVTNTGNFAGAEVAQLYIEMPDKSEPRMLRGFDKHWIQPGETTRYVFPLRRRDLSIWDIDKQQWAMQSGAYQVFASKSVLDVQLVGTFDL